MYHVTMYTMHHLCATLLSYLLSYLFSLFRPSLVFTPSAAEGLNSHANMQLWFAPFVSADVEALRYTGWHDVVADRRKDLYEADTQMITVQRTRELALQAIARHIRAHPGTPPGVDLFEFGVYTGGGMRMWLRMLARENISFDGQVWGFDSFEGMPAEDNRFKSKLRQHDKGWLAGGLNTAEQLRITDWPTLCKTIVHNIGHPPERIHLLRGFYNVSLSGGRQLAHRWRMRPALIVDLDCDLYTSSAQAMRFVLDAGILVVGTYVYLDDIGMKIWRAQNQTSLEQKLAFEEVTSEYGLIWEHLPLVVGRRDDIWERPVLQLVACERCQADAGRHEYHHTTSTDVPNCIVPD